MTPDQMRTAITANPGWAALDALKNLFGMEPTRAHVLQAERHGGMHDQRTIASIPDQVEHYQDMLAREYGLIFAPRIVFPVLSVVSFDRIRWDMGLQHVTSNCLSLGAKNDLRGAVPWLDPIEAAYLLILGRPSDPEGYSYWSGMLAGEMPLSRIMWHMERSDEAKGRV